MDGAGLLACPQEGPGLDRVTLDRLNSSGPRPRALGSRYRGGTYRKPVAVTAEPGWSAFDHLGTDTTAPVLLNVYPPNGAVDVPSGQNLIMEFDGAMAKGTGFISVCDSGDTCGLYNVATSAVEVDGPLVTIPITSLDAGETYYVLIPATALMDVAGNAYEGISSQTEWVFTIAPPVGAAVAFSIPSKSQSAEVESAVGAAVAFSIPGKTETATVESEVAGSVAFSIPAKSQTATVTSGANASIAFSIPSQTQTATVESEVAAAVAFNIPGKAMTATCEADIAAAVAFSIPGQTQTATTEVDVGAAVAFNIPAKSQTATVEMEVNPFTIEEISGPISISGAASSGTLTLDSVADASSLLLIAVSIDKNGMSSPEVVLLDDEDSFLGSATLAEEDTEINDVNIALFFVTGVSDIAKVRYDNDGAIGNAGARVYAVEVSGFAGTPTESISATNENDSPATSLALDLGSTTAGAFSVALFGGDTGTNLGDLTSLSNDYAIIVSDTGPGSGVPGIYIGWKYLATGGTSDGDTTGGFDGSGDQVAGLAQTFTDV